MPHFSLNSSPGLSPIMRHCLLGVSYIFQTYVSKVLSLPDRLLVPALGADQCSLPRGLVPIPSVLMQAKLQSSSLSLLSISPTSTSSPHSLLFIEVYSSYNVVLLSCIWKSNSNIFFFRCLSIIDYYKLLNMVSYAVQQIFTVLSILSITMCIF